MKTRWQLRIDTVEKAALTNLLTACPQVGVTVTMAPIGGSPPPPPPSPPGGCHPAYSPCLPNLAGDALNCGDLSAAQKPVTVLNPGVDPYNLDGDNDGIGCEGG